MVLVLLIYRLPQFWLQKMLATIEKHNYPKVSSSLLRIHANGLNPFLIESKLNTSDSGFLARNMNGSILHAQAKEYFCTNALVAELSSIRDACIFSTKLVFIKSFFKPILLMPWFVNDPHCSNSLDGKIGGA